MLSLVVKAKSCFTNLSSEKVKGSNFSEKHNMYRVPKRHKS